MNFHILVCNSPLKMSLSCTVNPNHWLIQGKKELWTVSYFWEWRVLWDTASRRDTFSMKNCSKMCSFAFGQMHIYSQICKWVQVNVWAACSVESLQMKWSSSNYYISHRWVDGRFSDRTCEKQLTDNSFLKHLRFAANPLFIMFQITLQP